MTRSIFVDFMTEGAEVKVAKICAELTREGCTFEATENNSKAAYEIKILGY